MKTDEECWTPGPGDRVGPYRIRAAIGDAGDKFLADGNGAVVLTALWMGPGEASRFARESRRVVAALEQLDCPALRPVRGTGADGALGWIASAPRDGEPLLEWCSSRSWTETTGALAELIRAVDRVESAGLLCDALLPDDVSVDARGQISLDAGASLTVRRWLLEAILAERGPAGARAGRHLTPEAQRGEPRTRRATQHVLCNIAWQALYGEFPYPDQPHYLVALYEGRLRPPRGDAAVPDAIRVVLARGLATEPAARWPSMTALLEALQRASLTPAAGC